MRVTLLVTRPRAGPEQIPGGCPEYPCDWSFARHIRGLVSEWWEETSRGCPGYPGGRRRSGAPPLSRGSVSPARGDRAGPEQLPGGCPERPDPRGVSRAPLCPKLPPGLRQLKIPTILAQKQSKIPTILAQVRRLTAMRAPLLGCRRRQGEREPVCVFVGGGRGGYVTNGDAETTRGIEWSRIKWSKSGPRDKAVTD